MDTTSQAVSTLIDVAQARRFLRALCGTPNADPVIVFQCVDDAKLDRPGLTECKGGSLASLLGYLRAQNQRGAAIFFQANAGGRGDAAITEPRALYIDDDLKAPHRPDLSALPPSATVRSSLSADGRPKQHHYWFLVENEPLSAWLSAMRHLAATLGTDPSICKLSQPMRLPGFLHCKGEPQRTELLKCDPARRFTIAEVLAAYPSLGKPRADGKPLNGANGTNGVHAHAAEAEKHALVDRALAGELPPPSPTKGADGHDPDEAPHTDASKVTFQRLCEWLRRIGEPFTTREARPRFIYLSRGCPRNREHKDAILIAGTRGGIIAKCFHDSCGSNRQSWADFRNILGGWAELKRGDHVELATRLRNELRAEYKSEIVTESGHKLAALYRYDAESGAWCRIGDEALSERIMTYAGLPFGEKAIAKKLNVTDVHGTLNLAKVRCAQPGFFEQAPAGALFANGFLVVRGASLVLLPHGPEHRARGRYNFSYNPEANAPHWLAFLHAIFEKDTDAEAKITLLQEFFGICILGLATRYQRSVFLTGGGSNGKSVCLKVLSALFPPELISAVRPHEMDNEYSRALLYGKRINVVSELPDRELLSVSGFNAMISGDLINGRVIREMPISFSPTAAHAFACNKLPRAKDFSQGFWRRVFVLKFNRQFKDTEQDEDLPTRLIEEELEGICNWCLIGGQRLLQRKRYIEPASSSEATAKWREQSNPVALWLEENAQKCALEGGTELDDLYQDFRRWADENGHERLSKIQFALRLDALEIAHVRKKIEGWPRTLYALQLRHNYAIS